MEEPCSLGDTVDCGHKNLNDKTLASVNPDYRVEDCHQEGSTVTMRVDHWLMCRLFEAGRGSSQVLNKTVMWKLEETLAESLGNFSD